MMINGKWKMNVAVLAVMLPLHRQDEKQDCHLKTVPFPSKATVPSHGHYFFTNYGGGAYILAAIVP